MFFIVARLKRNARTIPRKSPFTSVTPALCIAMSVPVPIAMPTSACASAGASLIPPHAGRRGRGPIVNTIARHRHLAPFALKTFYDLSLSRRQHFSNNIINPEPARDCLRGRDTVTSKHDDPDLLFVQLPDRFGCTLFDRIGDAENAGWYSIHQDEHHGLTF